MIRWADREKMHKIKWSQVRLLKQNKVKLFEARCNVVKMSEERLGEVCWVEVTSSEER